MLDITVKTLDGKNRTFSVSDHVTVREFKEHIASAIEIEPDVQRLIFQGRVLLDEKNIDDYNVNGKTIHVVQKPPPVAASPPDSSSSTDMGSAREREERLHRGANSFMLGSFTVPSPDSPNHINNFVHQMLSGMGEVGRNAEVTTHSSADGSSLDVHINMGRVGPPLQSESQNRIQQALQMLSSAADTLNRLENPEVSTSYNAESSTSNEPSRSHGTPSRTSIDDLNESSDREQSRNPSVSTLSSLLDQMLQVQDRLRPHLLRYRQLLNDDPDFSARTVDLANAQRLCELASEAMHELSHSYHHISDLTVDWNHPPPRHVRASPVNPAAAIIQQTIPVQINLAHVPITPSVALSPSTAAQSAGTVSQSIAGCPRARTSEAGAHSNSHMHSQPRAAAPHVRSTSTSGAFPIRPPAALPHGFHVFMEMAPGVATSNVPSSVSSSSSGTSSTTSTPSGTTSVSSLQQSALPSFVPSRFDMTSSASGGGGGIMPPSDLLQNIIHMAASAALQGQSGRQVFMMSPSASDQANPVSLPQFLSSTTVTSSPFQIPASSQSVPLIPGISTTMLSTSAPQTSFTPLVSSSSASASSQQLSSATEIGNRPGHLQTSEGSSALHVPVSVQPVIPVPVIPPQFSYGSGELLQADPILPCHSRHFLSRRATVAGNQTTIQNPEQLFTGFLSNVVASIVRPLSEIGSGLTPPSSATMQIPSASLHSSSDGRNLSSSATSTASSQSASVQRGSTVADHDMLSNIMHGINGELQQVLMGRSSRSIGDFLAHLGSDYSLPQGEGLLTDLFRIVASHLAFSDLMMIFFGQPASLERLREPLREFVSQNILLGSLPLDANINAAVERVIQQMQHDLSALGAGAQTNENIDYVSTVQRFLRTQLDKFIRLIANSSASSGFASNLYESCRNFVHEFIVLSRYCLSGGQDALQALMQERLRAISYDMNPSMQNTMSVMATQQLQQILPTILLRDEAVYHYIVRRDVESAQSSSSDSSFASACDVPDSVMEEASSSMNEMTYDGFVSQPRISDVLLSHLTTPPDSNSDADIEITLGSEDWHAAVPSEWIPVIARDVVKQRRQAPQPALSDAYLSGMPSKRRKIMVRDRRREDFGDLRSVFSDMVQRAVQQAGANPFTSQRDVVEEAVSSSQLCATFQQELDATILHRLACDPDYIPEKYPNIEKFFKSC